MKNKTELFPSLRCGTEQCDGLVLHVYLLQRNHRVLPLLLLHCVPRVRAVVGLLQQVEHGQVLAPVTQHLQTQLLRVAFRGVLWVSVMSSARTLVLELSCCSTVLKSWFCVLHQCFIKHILFTQKWKNIDEIFPCQTYFPLC